METPLNSYESLKNSIVRASSWEQIFPSKEQAGISFMNLVLMAKQRFESANTLQEYRVEKSEDGDVHIFELKNTGRPEKYLASYQILKTSGNVIHVIDSFGVKDVTLILPDVGNIAHNYSFNNVFIPDYKSINKLDTDEYQKITGYSRRSYGTFLQFIKGKPATRGWEEIMLNSGYLPQRIGYSIYPDFVLAVQSRLMVTHPEYFQK